MKKITVISNSTVKRVGNNIILRTSVSSNGRTRTSTKSIRIK